MKVLEDEDEDVRSYRTSPMSATGPVRCASARTARMTF